MGKRKKKGSSKLTVFIAVVAIIVIIAVAVFFGISYVSVSKKIDAADAQIENINVEQNNLSFDARVTGDIESYDVILRSDEDKIIKEDSEDLDKLVSYSVVLEYNTEYQIVIALKSTVFHRHPLRGWFPHRRLAYAEMPRCIYLFFVFYGIATGFMI